MQRAFCVVRFVFAPQKSRNKQVCPLALHGQHDELAFICTSVLRTDYFVDYGDAVPPVLIYRRLVFQVYVDANTFFYLDARNEYGSSQ